MTPDENLHMDLSSSPPRCPACGREDWSVAYERLRDRLHDIPGEFDLWRCGSCGLLQLWPPPGDPTRFYPDDYYSYARASVPANNLRQSLVEWVRLVQLRLAWRAHTLGLKLPRFVTRHPWLRSQAFRELVDYAGRSVSSVLDIGCGGGDFLLSAQALGLRVRGVEMSDPAASTARSRGLDCDGGGIDALAAIDRGYDVIRLSDVLEHLVDPLETLSAVARSLSPSGVVIIRVPNVEGVMARLCGPDWFAIEAPRHLWGFGRESLALLLEHAGLSIVRMETKSQEYVLYCSLRNLLQSRAELELPAHPTEEFLRLCTRIGWMIDQAQLGDHLLVVAEQGQKARAGS